MQKRFLLALKRAFSEISPDLEAPVADAEQNIPKSHFQDLCNEIYLEIFQYLPAVDLLYSFTGLDRRLDGLVAPYTHALDFRRISRSHFECLSQRISPFLNDQVRLLCLSNAGTFSQISELLYKLDWSRINQLESLTMESLDIEDISRYVTVVHPLLERLWRLTMTLNDTSEPIKELMITHMLTRKPGSSQPLTHLSIVGIAFDLTKFARCDGNENLRELTITLATVEDLFILFKLVPQLEILTCTVLTGTFLSTTEKFTALNHLSALTLALEKPIPFENLRDILIPHRQLKYLCIRAILREPTGSNRADQTSGLEFEKIFRTFSRLTKLQFYFCIHQTDPAGHPPIPPNDIYFLSFKSSFWLQRAIQVETHLVHASRQRYIYTSPFAFDKFNVIGSIPQFFADNHAYAYSNVRHLSLALSAIFVQHIYLSVIRKHFPKLRMLTLCDESVKPFPSNFLEKYSWIRQASTATNAEFPCTYILNRRKASDVYLNSLDKAILHRQIVANKTKHIRQLTIYEMTERQSTQLCSYFPSLQVLVLHVDSTELLSLSTCWLPNLMMKMTSLFSLTIHYPTSAETDYTRASVVDTLLASKKHFFIKSKDGVLNIWF